MNFNLPPMHPALVHFPIALVTLSFIFDLLGKLFRKDSFRSAGWWTLLAAAVTGIISVPLGYWDMNRDMLNDETHQYVDMHLKIGWVLLIVVAGLTIWRGYLRAKTDQIPGGGYLFAAFLVTCLTLFQGWFGGEMVYAHGAGVAAADQGTVASEPAKRPLATVRDVLEKVPGLAADDSEHHHHETATHGKPVNEPAGAQTNQHHESHE
jgi:uncharacterized membrane protein